MDTHEARRLLRAMFDAAIAAAQPGICVPPFLPGVPKGRLVVIGPGKASASMARAVEDLWRGAARGRRMPGEAARGHGSAQRLCSAICRTSPTWLKYFRKSPFAPSESEFMPLFDERSSSSR